MLMFAAVLGFFVVIAVAAMLGWTADSRDGADRTPSDGRKRMPRRI